MAANDRHEQSVHSSQTTMMKSHIFEQIMVNHSKFRVPCYKFDVKLYYDISPKPYVNYNMIEQFISKLLAPKLV